jgi:hypothetical protein
MPESKSQSQNATEQALQTAATELIECDALISRGAEAKLRAVAVIKEYQKVVGKQRRHLESLAQKAGLHVATLYRWIQETKEDVRILSAAEAGDSYAQAAVAAVERGERKTFRSAEMNMPVPANCPLCELRFPSRIQLRKHGVADHGVTSEGVADFLDPTKKIRLAQQQKADRETYQRSLAEQTLPVVAAAYKSVSLILPMHYFNDGAEHKFVSGIQSAIDCARRSAPFTEEEKREFKYLADHLRSAVKELSELANQIDAELAVHDLQVAA